MRQFQDNARQQAAAVVPAVSASEQALISEVGTDNYQQAFNHVDQHVTAQLQAMHPGADPQMLSQVKGIASLQFLQQCQANGVDPARHIWDFAQQLGFTPGMRTPHAPGGDLPRVARTPGNTSLSNLGGASDPTIAGKLTAERVSSMTDAEFDQLCANMRKQSSDRAWHSRAQGTED